MDSIKELISRFWNDGVLVLESFFTAGELAEVDAKIQEHYASAPPGTKPENFHQYETFTDPWAGKGDAFDALTRHPKLEELTTALLGPNFIYQYCLVMQTRPSTGQAWHQDTSCDDPTKFVLNRVVYPRDVLPEAGGIIFVPGSHKRGRIPPGPNHEPLPGEVALHPKAGTLVLLHSFTWHRVGMNRSNGPRWTANFRCRPATCTEDRDAVGVYRNSAYNFRTMEVVPEN